jgi:hypothetical protein
MLAIAALAQAQPAGGRSQISGTVTSANTASPQLSLKNDEGAAVSVTITDRTVIRRIPPGETDSRKGARIALPDVSTGDRAVIVGPLPADPATWVATAVLVMTNSDVASLQRYAPGAPPAGAGNGSADIGQMLDNLPAMALSELKAGDAIMVSTTQGSTSGRVTAIMCLAGVDPLLTAS